MTTRRTLPARRAAEIFMFEADGVRYRATLGRFADGRPAELFLDGQKFASSVQVNAETSAVLVSLLLQHDVPLDVIRHSVRGPVGAALDLIAKAERGT